MSSGFITEAEAVDIRKKRQEEWERVRSASDPIERPEEPYDNRSLFDRLQEQKQKKDLEYQEAHKLKNMIRGLDNDEVDFLELVDKTKLAADSKKSEEEEKELNDFRNRVASLQEETVDHKAPVKKPNVNLGNKRSQVKLLKGAVVKKEENIKKRKIEHETNVNVITMPSALRCAGVLPGLGCYDNSSSDDTTDSDSDDDCRGEVKYDLLGRKIVENSSTES